jgi:HAD superfamily hydrolase (TIGR01459 family)
MTPATLPDLAEAHDAFLVDQFGVLLDGAAAYPWAPEALSWLAGTGKPVILLSNSGKRSTPNADRLERLGFSRGSFRLVLSSGEAAWMDLSGRGLAAGTRVWLHSRDGDTSAIDGLGLREVAHPENAALLVLAGSRADEMTLADYEGLLAPAARAGVPMLCTNPDLEMLTPGGRRPGAGRIATLYAELGGPVDYVGKPHPLIYSVARRLLDGIDPARVLCLGDSPAHDIAGGHAAGMRTALVRTGLTGDVPDAALRDFCLAEAGVLPDYVLARFDAET